MAARARKRDREDLPSVDSLGELVAFQGPPKLTALDISPLHIPRHFHHQRSDVTRGALRGTEKKQPRRRIYPSASAARDTHTRVRKNSGSLSRARLLSVSFVVIRLWGTDSRGLTAVYQAADWSIAGHGV